MKSKKAKKIAQKGRWLRQVAALPYRQRNATVELLLVTSRNTRRFLIPKGWPVKGKSDQHAAGVEAKQEAGVVGPLDRKPIGSYRYWKRVKDAFVPVRVIVYALRVENELVEWKERRQRKRAWLRRDQAATLIDEPELVSLVLRFSPANRAAE